MSAVRIRWIAAAGLAAAALASVGPVAGSASAQIQCKARMMWGDDIYDGYGASRQAAIDDAMHLAWAHGESGSGEVLYVTC